jgi:hypothetical protein
MFNILISPSVKLGAKPVPGRDVDLRRLLKTRPGEAAVYSQIKKYLI